MMYLKQMIGLMMLVFIVSCTQNDEQIIDEGGLGNEFENATIIGLDIATCACCGDYLIEIEGIEERTQFAELPDGSEINLNPDNLPLDVLIVWDYKGEGFCPNFIEITNIEKK